MNLTVPGIIAKPPLEFLSKLFSFFNVALSLSSRYVPLSAAYSSLNVSEKTVIEQNKKIRTIDFLTCYTFEIIFDTLISLIKIPSGLSLSVSRFFAFTFFISKLKKALYL